jgi:hypothetical protein
MPGPLQGGCVVRYSNTSAHAMLETSSIARATPNAHRAKAPSTFTTSPFILVSARYCLALLVIDYSHHSSADLTSS